MLGWKLVDIEYGSRLVEAEYVDNRLSGFIARTKKNDDVAALSLRQRVAHLFRRLAGFIDEREMDIGIRVRVAQLSKSIDVRSGLDDDFELPAISGGVCDSTGNCPDPLAFDFHVPLDMFESTIAPERTTTLYFSIEGITS